MRTKPRVLSLILILIMLLPAFKAHAQEMPVSGDYQYKLDESGKASIVRYTGAEAGTLMIPELLDGHPVVAIGQAAFMGNKFTSVVIPAGLTSITPGVFCNCTVLTSIDVAAGNTVYGQTGGVLFDKVQKSLHTYPIARPAADYQIPDGILTIGSGAFFGCVQLASVALAGTLTTIGENAFYGCANLLSMSIPNGVTDISNGAFAMCGSLNSIILPGSVKTIGNGVFDGCLNLNSITVAADNPIFEMAGGVLFDKQQRLLHTYPQALLETSYQVPDGTLQIGSLAFASCIKLTSVIIPDSVTAIGESAFLGCTNLESAVLPKGLAKLPASVFAACEHLKSIEVPDGVTSIGPQAFSNCTDLKQANIPYGATEVGPYAFAYCGNLREMTIPATVLSIGDGAFMACDFMASVLIQPGVQTIGAYAFSECSYMTSASIPPSITLIGENAFSGCGKLAASVVENSFAHDYFIQNKLDFTLGK